MSSSPIQALLVKSAIIQSEIDRETRTLRPDWLRLLRLKRLKLVLAERLRRMLSRAASGFAPLGLVPALAAPVRRPHPGAR